MLACSPVVPPPKHCCKNVVALRFREKPWADVIRPIASLYRGFPSWRLCRWVSLYIHKQLFSNYIINNFSHIAVTRTGFRPVSLPVLIWTKDSQLFHLYARLFTCKLTFSQSDNPANSVLSHQILLWRWKKILIKEMWNWNSVVEFFRSCK